MKTKKVTKLWQGKFVSVRDYELADAIKKGGLLITHNENQMFLDVDELQKLKPSGKVHQSKFKGTYQLVDILWNKNDKRQGELNGI
jgi:hypothetical protein